MDAMREALRALVEAAPDPSFVRQAALDDDSDPACMTEEGEHEPFCACGRRWADCDGSRRGCHKRRPAPPPAKGTPTTNNEE